MPEIDENNLREEEQAGFQPGTPDDDTFLLDDKEEYPGELPEIPTTGTGDAEEISSIGDSKIGGIKITEAEQIEVPKEGTIWEQFDGKKPEDEDNIPGVPAVTDEKPDESFVERADTEESLPPIVETESEEKEETVSLDKLSIEKEESVASPTKAGLIEDEELPPKTDSEIDETEQIPEEPVKIDDDLAALIQEDLQKAKKRAEKVEEPKVIEQPAIQPEEELQEKLDQFKPVEEKGDTEMIDLMQVGAGEPAISEIEDAKQAEEVIEVAPQPPPAAEEKKEEKEKKKIIIPWKRVGIAAAAVILLAAVGIGGYSLLWDKLFPPKEKKTAVAVVKQKTKEIKKAAEPKVVPKTDTAAAKPEIKESKKEPDVAVTAVDIAPKEMKKAKPVTEKPKPVIVEKPKPVIIEKPKPVIAEKPKPIVTEKQKPVVVEKPKEKPVVATIEKKPEKEPVTKPLVLTPEKKNVFTVQVYTSPSKDDAEDWMKILKRKNINGFISTQKMRDKVWYRVRFGFYDTREEARAAAEKLGFDQVWIDQIR
ncbi:MAG: SPOR domain-containing protein [Ignavibacteriae bacterium]|nr:SPOR domain-containing protein [Ignavibacteriota bacterium]